MAIWVFFEPVDYHATVYDTDTLQIIRGASLTLLKAPEAFVARLKEPQRKVFFSSSVICEVDMGRVANAVEIPWRRTPSM